MEKRKKKDNHNKNNAYQKIEISINIDHGKGHSRISANFILRYQDDSCGGAWCKDSYQRLLGNDLWKKDNAEIIYNTFGTMLDDDLL